VSIGASAAVVSGVNSYDWFAGRRTAPIAVLMSIAMVGSAILLPDFAIALWKVGRRILGLLFLLSGVVAIAFCMVTTVSALYEGRSMKNQKEYENARIQESDAGHKKALEDALAGYRAELSGANSLVSATQAKVDEIPSGETLSEPSQALVGRLNRYLADRRKIQGKIDDVQDKLLAEDKVAAGVSRADFYTFISRLLGSAPEAVEFWTGALPAVFLDMVGPVMVAVVLFL
jgi:hypothetical protein